MPVTSDSATQDLSIAQIASLLVQRWRVVLAGGIIGIMAGAAVLAFVAPAYRYTSVIEIARIATEATATAAEEPVEASESAVTKLEGAIIPSTQRVLADAHPERSSLGRVRIKAVSVKDGGRIVSLESGGPLVDAPFHVQLHEAVIVGLAKTHERPLALARNALDNSQAALMRKKAELADQLQGLTRQEALLVPSRSMLEGQIAALRQELKAEEPRQAAGSTGGEQTLAILLVGSTQEQKQVRIAALEERLTIDLKKQAEELAKTKAEVVRKQGDLDSDISRLHMRLADLSPTRAVLAPQRSLRPIGLGQSSLFLVLVAGGLIIAMAGAVLWPTAQRRP